MNILQLLATSSFITVNKSIIKAIGLEEAVLLGELSSEYSYWANRGELQDGWFFSTVENIEDKTTLNDYKQRKAIKKLEETGVLETTVKGTPPKRYFKINEDVLITIMGIQFSNISRFNSQNFKDSILENLKTNNNITNKNINNKIYSDVINYLNLKTGKRFSPKSKSTIKYINGRLNEGYTLEDFYKVIDNKVAQWKGDSRMDKFLRPSTLFNSDKFDGYLNETIISTGNRFADAMNEMQDEMMELERYEQFNSNSE